MQPIPGYTELCDNAVLFAQGDALDLLPAIPEASIDLALIDPPYNIHKAEWDKIADYTAVFLQWVQAIRRPLKPNGVFIFWHNDLAQLAELMTTIRQHTDFRFKSIIIWDKTPAYRANAQGFSGLTRWFNQCEFALHYTVKSTPTTDHLATIKEWFKTELERLKITRRDIAQRYTQVTGRQPFMMQHYFSGHQFQLPTKEIWEQVFAPFGFDIARLSGTDYTDMQEQYKAMQSAYKQTQPCFRLTGQRGNVYRVTPIFDGSQIHPCQKPVAILADMITKCCPEGGTVLDCFAGSGSTGVAALKTGRQFVGIERDPHYAGLAIERLSIQQRQTTLIPALQSLSPRTQHLFCTQEAR